MAFTIFGCTEAKNQVVNKRYDVINKKINYPDFCFGLSFTHKKHFDLWKLTYRKQTLRYNSHYKHMLQKIIFDFQLLLLLLRHAPDFWCQTVRRVIVCRPLSGQHFYMIRILSPPVAWAWSRFTLSCGQNSGCMDCFSLMKVKKPLKPWTCGRSPTSMAEKHV